MKKHSLFWLAALALLVWPVLGSARMVDVEIQSDRNYIFPLFPVSSERPQTYRAYLEAVRGERYGRTERTRYQGHHL